MWSTPLTDGFRPGLRDVLGYYSHPFPSRDGNRRSFIEIAEVKEFGLKLTNVFSGYLGLIKVYRLDYTVLVP